jgi:CRISPR-associated endonuclease Csn1
MELLKELDKHSNENLNSKKLYLWFTQLCKCAYTGKYIPLTELYDNKKWDIDHIYPQSKVKDDSLQNNLVLVDTIKNKDKSDKCLIELDGIQTQMHGFWHQLKESNLITPEKYKRLTRTTPFSDDELAGFINRQLVETRQSTKIIAELLQEKYAATQIVYVKAGIVSDFRQEFKIGKCREVNDLHHAKDAYLNIVCGNVYYSRFTGNPINFIKKHRNNYSVKVKTVFGEIFDKVWCKGDLERVKRQLNKNNILYSRYTFKRKGAFFDQNIVKKGKNDGLIPIKTNMPTDRFGGYNGVTVSFFAAVRYKCKKGESVQLVPIRLIDLPKYEADKAEFLTPKIKGCKEIIQIKEVKINSILEINGTKLFVTGKSGTRFLYQICAQLQINSEHEKYIKKLFKIREKILLYSKFKKGTDYIITEHDGVTVEENLKLLEVLALKIAEPPYCNYFSEKLIQILNNKEKFINETINKQVIFICEAIKLFQSNAAKANFADWGGNKDGDGELKKSLSLGQGKWVCKLIDRSVTGVFEKRTKL